VPLLKINFVEEPLAQEAAFKEQAMYIIDDEKLSAANQEPKAIAGSLDADISGAVSCSNSFEAADQMTDSLIQELEISKKSIMQAYVEKQVRLFPLGS